MWPGSTAVRTIAVDRVAAYLLQRARHWGHEEIASLAATCCGVGTTLEVGAIAGALG